VAETNGKAFWTPKEAARWLQVSAWVIYGYTRKRKKRKNPPPMIRLSRSIIRFPIDEFKAWANAQRPRKET